jgi:O-antigen/teichoic acid export membrane protein
MSLLSRRLFHGILKLGSGEVLTRLCGVAVLLILARRFGVVVVGVYALAQGMVQYSYPFIDFGLRHVGARLIAQYPEASQEIVQQVQKRRILMGSLILPFLLCYASLVNLPRDSKTFLFLFSAIGCLYALSLEWAAWGKEHLRMVGLTRALVPGSVLLFLLLGWRSNHVLWWIILGNAVGYGMLAATFRQWWRRHKPRVEGQIPLAAIRENLAWRRTSVMGVAWFCNMAFASVDMLMLGIMSNPRQVGLYSAAYRIMSQVLFTYYLLNSALYPQLARQNKLQRLRMLRPRILLAVAGMGVVIAGLVTLVRRPLVTILFGHEFLPATLLLMLLVWAIPLDFLTSYLSNAYIAWGMEKKILICTVIGAGSNVILNFFSIPAYGATAAAVNTLISYVIFLASLAIAGRSAKELTIEPEQVAELIA